MSDSPQLKTAYERYLKRLIAKVPASYPGQPEKEYHSSLGADVSLSRSERLQGIYVIGSSGTGKSTLLENLIIEDIEQGLGVCLIEPHGDITHNVLARIPQRREKDIIHLDLTQTDFPFGLNLFDCANPASALEVAYTHSFVTHVFHKLLEAGEQTPQLNRVLRNVTYTLIANPGTTFLEIQPLLLDQDVRDKLVANVTNPQVRSFWDGYKRLSDTKRGELVASFINRVDKFATDPILQNIVGQSKTTLDFRRIMDEGKILLVQLPPVLEEIANLVGAVIIGKLLAAAYSRRDTLEKKRRQFHIYADEFQRFAVEDFAILFAEARKFKIGLTVAHQFREQLDEKNRKATLTVANMVVFRVTPDDATELAGRFDTTPAPAWEEELEKEWVETLEKEWIETVGAEWVETIAEEWVETLEQERIEIRDLEVTDGTEPIKAVSQNPIDFILKNSHGSSEVRELRASFLARLDNIATDRNLIIQRSIQNGLFLLNNLLVYMMEHRQNTNREHVLEQVTDIFVAIWEYKKDERPSPFQHWREEMRPFLLAVVREQYQAYEAGERQLPVLKRALEDWKAWMIKEHIYDYKIEELPDIRMKGFDHYLYVKQSNEKHLERQKEIYPEIEKIANSVVQVLRLCFALRDNPIYVSTGQEQPRTRTQPHIIQHPRYTLVHPRQTLQHPREVLPHPRQVLQHPRKTLLHPQRTYQDMSNQLASEISRLPNYTAKIRTGAEERTIITVAPGRGLTKAALQARKNSVQDNNQRANYLRPRDEVAQEIRERQRELQTKGKPVARATSDDDEETSDTSLSPVKLDGMLQRHDQPATNGITQGLGDDNTQTRTTRRKASTKPKNPL